MALSHAVTLHTGTTGLGLDVWDRYDLTLDMLSPGSPWTVSLWHSETRQAAWRTLHREVRLWDLMFWSIDGAAEVNGRVETIETTADRQGAVMVLSGRDMAGPALDWDADPTVRLAGKSLEEVLALLFGPLGISTRIGESADGTRLVQTGTRRGPRGGTRTARRAIVDQAHPRPGERAWQLAESIVRRMGYLLWTAPHPELGLSVVVDTPDFTSTPVFRFERRREPGTQDWTGNILSGGQQINGREVPTEVNVYTHAPRGGSVSARSHARVANAGLLDARVTRSLVVGTLPTQPRHKTSDRARTLAAATREGERTVADAMARFRTHRVTVQGHGQVVEDRVQLYAVNTMAHVRDDLTIDGEERPLDEDMLITRVEFQGGRREGQTTTLTLVPKDSIVLTPEDA